MILRRLLSVPSHWFSKTQRRRHREFTITVLNRRTQKSMLSMWENCLCLFRVQEQYGHPILSKAYPRGDC